MKVQVLRGVSVEAGAEVYYSMDKASVSCDRRHPFGLTPMSNSVVDQPNPTAKLNTRFINRGQVSVTRDVERGDEAIEKPLLTDLLTKTEQTDAHPKVWFGV